MSVRSWLVVSGLAALASGFTSAHAESPHAHAATPLDASQSTPTEVMVLHATQTASPSVDPRIGKMPQLAKPPFSSFNTYKLLDKKTLGVEKSKPSSYSLPNGRTLQVSVEPAGGAFKVSASISQERGDFKKLFEVTAAKGEPFFVAGQSFEGGKLVIALTVK